MAAVVEIILEGKDKASDVISGLQGSLGGLADIAKGALTVGFGVAAAGAGALAAGLGLSISEAISAEKVQAQLEAVLKSTGGQAGVTSEMANDLATSISKLSTFSDDAILKGENLLLTFTNIGKDVFPDATQIMVDMASALGTDVSGGAIQLGKALNDPIAGIGALSRVGVSFTEEQKKLIQSLVETGDVAGAQRIILEELGKEFGGSAAAQAATFGGQMEVVKNQLLNVAEGIGMSLLPIGKTLIDTFLMPALPVIEGVGNALSTFFTALINGQNPLSSIALLIGNVGSAFGLTSTESQNLSRNVMTFLNDGKIKFEEFQTAIQPVVDALQIGFNQIAASVVPFIQNTLLPAISSITSQISGELPTAQSVFQVVINGIVGAIQLVTTVITTVLIPILTNVVNWVVTNWPTIQATVQNVFAAIQNIINQVMPVVLNVITTVLTGIQTFWNNHGQAIMTIVTSYFNQMKIGIETIINVIRSVIEFVLERIQIFWDAWGETIMQVIRNMTQVIGSIIEAFASALQGDWTAFGEHLRDAWDGIWESIKLIVTNAIDIFLNFDWAGIGTNIIEGIANGISAATGFIQNAATRAAQAALDAIKGLLGIHSPSRVFAGIGQNMMQGMAIGINKNAQLPATAMERATKEIVTNTTNNYSLNITSNARTEDLVANYRTMEVLLGGI
jgi:hypothetical protein